MAATETGIAAGPQLDKGYDPARVEPGWARFWEERGFFHAQDESKKPPYSIVLPPPNITGSLHIGHALTATLEDVLVRWKRMSGHNVCWMPGTDHAGIATQMVVERELQKRERKSRHDLGRDEFVRRVWEWKRQYGQRIAQQHRALGASLDWQRERFTMDEDSSRAVREAFVRLYEEGLLYRAERLINWCVRDGTALSDLEVEHEEGAKGELYKFAYPLADDSGEIVVATTRPETMLGDTAVAVHPADPRYRHLVGKEVRHPLLDRTFPIIADAELVDPKFGTGAVKVTPGHSFEDFETGKRHKLQLINILNPDGTLNENAGRFKGQDRIRVRPALKEALRELGLERGSEPHTLALGRCQRCDSIIEPLLSKQWFVKTEPLARPVVEAVEAGKIRFVPEAWKAEFFRWLRNIHDWCVSRQLWWGHQIPAWTCWNGHVTVARDTPKACTVCSTTVLRQDPDVLDTWFSSGLWPFSTFGWPEKTKALETFYPNSVLETGFDILFFWVARMAMLGLHLTGEVPFRTVFLHAMVRDEKGEKMSKTRGNTIDPLDVTAKQGADALRFTLAAMAAQGRDIKLSLERVAGYRAFANKIWNAARFVLMNAEGYDPERPAKPASVYDRWILSRFSRCAEEATAALEEFRLSDAANRIYRFVWGELCDWAIELSKPALYGERSAAERAGAQAALVRALEGALRLLHPFMPFVTEEIWQRLPKRRGHEPSIMISRYPTPDPTLVDAEAEAEMDLVARAIDGARSIRGEVNLPPNKAVPIVLLPRDEAARKLLETHQHAFARLAAASSVTVAKVSAPRPQKAAAHVEPEVEVHLPLAGVIDFVEERKRVEKELSKLEAELRGLRARVGNEDFVARAPSEVVARDRARTEELAAKKQKLARHMARVSSPEVGMEEQERPENKGAHGAGDGEHRGAGSEQGQSSAHVGGGPREPGGLGGETGAPEAQEAGWGARNLMGGEAAQAEAGVERAEEAPRPAPKPKARPTKRKAAKARKARAAAARGAKKGARKQKRRPAAKRKRGASRGRTSARRGRGKTRGKRRPGSRRRG